MKLIQIYCEDGAEYGLFSYKRHSEERVVEIVEECHRKADMAIQEIASDDEEEDVDDIFENYLSEYGIERVFIDQEIYLPQLQ